MALEDMQSQYGPFNKKGQIGTGKTVDPLSGEGAKNLGHENANSKYKTTNKNGKPEKKMDGLAKGNQ